MIKKILLLMYLLLRTTTTFAGFVEVGSGSYNSNNTNSSSIGYLPLGRYYIKFDANRYNQYYIRNIHAPTIHNMDNGNVVSTCPNWPGDSTRNIHNIIGIIETANNYLVFCEYGKQSEYNNNTTYPIMYGFVINKETGECYGGAYHRFTTNISNLQAELGFINQYFVVRFNGTNDSGIEYYLSGDNYYVREYTGDDNLIDNYIIFGTHNDNFNLINTKDTNNFYGVFFKDVQDGYNDEILNLYGITSFLSYYGNSIKQRIVATTGNILAIGNQLYRPDYDDFVSSVYNAAVSGAILYHYIDDSYGIYKEVFVFKYLNKYYRDYWDNYVTGNNFQTLYFDEKNYYLYYSKLDDNGNLIWRKYNLATINDLDEDTPPTTTDTTTTTTSTTTASTVAYDCFNYDGQIFCQSNKICKNNKIKNLTSVFKYIGTGSYEIVIDAITGTTHNQAYYYVDYSGGNPISSYLMSLYTVDDMLYDIYHYNGAYIDTGSLYYTNSTGFVNLYSTTTATYDLNKYCYQIGVLYPSKYTYSGYIHIIQPTDNTRIGPTTTIDINNYYAGLFDCSNLNIWQCAGKIASDMGRLVVDTIKKPVDNLYLLIEELKKVKYTGTCNYTGSLVGNNTGDNLVLQSLANQKIGLLDYMVNIITAVVAIIFTTLLFKRND